MKLRKLEIKDADRMLEWMHDFSVVENLRTDFSSKTIEDCKTFIENSIDTDRINLAVVDDNDVYMGTVSLRNINECSAEFAITICKDAMGKGYSSWAMREIFKYGFEHYKLSRIYWCVSKENTRAMKFYDKNGYTRVSSNSLENFCDYSEEEIDSYVWYSFVR